MIARGDKGAQGSGGRDADAAWFAIEAVSAACGMLVGGGASWAMPSVALGVSAMPAPPPPRGPGGI